MLEVDRQDIGAKSDTHDKTLLVAVDKADKFLVASAPPAKEALAVTRKIVDVVLTFGLPLYVQTDQRTEIHGRGDEPLMQAVTRDHRT